MTADILIRPLNPSDAQAFRDLRLEALATSPEAFGSSYEEEVRTPLEKIQQNMPASGPNAIFSAFAGDIPIGMAGFVVHERVKMRHKGIMWGVYVKSEWRGHRVGKALVQRVIEHASQHVMILEATVGLANENARRTYHALGFKPYGIARKALRVGDRFYDEELLALDFQAEGD